MKKYIVVVRHDQGQIGKYQDFDNKSDATAHVAKFGGFVALPPTGPIMKNWVADPVAKTVTIDQAARITDLISNLRIIRDIQLEKSDKSVLPDRWDTMDVATQAKWSTYRQKLRDLPATVVDPTNPVWPTKPE